MCRLPKRQNSELQLSRKYLQISQPAGLTHRHDRITMIVGSAVAHRVSLLSFTAKTSAAGMKASDEEKFGKCFLAS